MKKTIATILSLAAVSAAFGQGTFATVSNNIGGTVYPIFQPDGTTIASGANYSVQVFLYDASAAGNLGAQVGNTVSPSANGRFNAGSNIAVPNHAAGTTVDLIVVAWDKTTGASYAEATTRGDSGKFTSEILGGTPPGGGLPITGKTIVSGLAGGYKSFSLVGKTEIPEPTTIALGALGAAALFIRRRK